MLLLAHPDTQEEPLRLRIDLYIFFGAQCICGSTGPRLGGMPWLAPLPAPEKFVLFNFSDCIFLQTLAFQTRPCLASFEKPRGNTLHC